MEINFKQLGPYEIGKKLGAGGMGTVYAAMNSETGKPAAVKVLSPTLALQQGFRERFEAEIESLKKLEHPNIVELYGYGQKDAFLFYAMELVDGASLEEELSHGRRFDWREVTQIGIKLSRALKLAHDYGIIHRDIKPANVLMGDDGEIKLSDFGVARLFGNTGLTNEGGVLGTAEYMAPEQADGGPVTHRCDLYSLGGVLYALLAGRPPFRSESMLELLQLQRFATPDGVRRYAPEAPRELEKIISQLLAKQPEDRFPNALMLTRRLEAMEKGLSVKAAAEKGTPPPPGATLLDDSTGASNDQGDAGEDKTDAKKDNENASLSDTIARFVDEDDQAAASPHGSNGQSPMATGQGPLSSGDDFRSSLKHDSDDVQSDHFTTIEDERTRELISERESVPLISLPTIFLILSLIGTSFLIWYSIRPPSEGDLLERIEVVARIGDDVRLREVEDEIGMFLNLYGESKSAPRIKDYQDRLNVARLSGRALRQANDLFRRYPDSIIAGDFVDAIRIAPSQPEQALAKLQAIVDLYGNQSRRHPEIRSFVDAANMQIPRLRRRVEDRRENYQTQIERQLDKAQRLGKNNPQKANQIRQAVIDLYAAQPWAEDLVSRARGELQAVSTSETETTSPEEVSEEPAAVATDAQKPVAPE